VNYEQIAVWSNVACALLFYVVLIWMWVKFAQPAVLAAQANTNKALAETERHRDEAKASLDVLRAEIEGAARASQMMEEAQRTAAVELDAARAGEDATVRSLADLMLEKTVPGAAK